MLTALVSYQDH